MSLQDTMEEEIRYLAKPGQRTLKEVSTWLGLKDWEEINWESKVRLKGTFYFCHLYSVFQFCVCVFPQDVFMVCT